MKTNTNRVLRGRTLAGLTAAALANAFLPGALPAQKCIQFQDYLSNVGRVPSLDARGVAVSDAMVFLADGEDGLIIIDAADPQAPAIVGAVKTPGRASAVALSDSLALVAAYGAGLAVVDVTPSGPPRLIGLSSEPLFALDVAILGSRAYVADPLSGLFVINFGSDPGEPFVEALLAMPGPPISIEIEGTLAVIAMYQAGFTLVDLTNPQAPIVVGSADTQGFAHEVAARDDYVYVADITRGLQIFDISEPSQPTLVGASDTPSLSLGVTVEGGIAYVADWDSGLRTFNVENPEAPVPLGIIELPGGVQATVVANGYAYLAHADFGLAIVQVGNAQSPLPIGTLDPPAPVVQVSVEGSLAAIAYGGGFALADVSSPKAPQILSEVNQDANHVVLSNTRAFVAAGPFIIYDITDPASLKELWRASPGGLEVDVEGDFAFLAAGHLVVHDVARFIERVGELSTIGFARSVVVDSNLVYVADALSGVLVVDASDPTAMHIVGQLRLDDARDVAIDGNTLYVADGGAGLVVVDVADPSSPIRIGSAGEGFDATAVQYGDGFAYLAIGESGVAVFDVSVPSTPILVGLASTNDDVVSVTLGSEWFVTAGEQCHFFPRQCGNMAPPAIAHLGSAEALGLKVTPNPIQGSSVVLYDLPQPGSVRITAYDVTGRCRRVLLEGVMPAGEGSVQWDRHLQGSQRLPSGAYFIRLEIRERSRVQRVTVLR